MSENQKSSSDVETLIRSEEEEEEEGVDLVEAEAEMSEKQADEEEEEEGILATDDEQGKDMSDSKAEIEIGSPEEEEEEGEFSVSDLVWGKVKSHPWWPGQIFPSSDASERAIKYKKRDAFLVAYFGDQTFAWNDPSSLLHFQTHFSQMENQSSSDSFTAAVRYALDELFARVLFGMTCSCTPKLPPPPHTVFLNAGIRKDANKNQTPHISLSATSFHPPKLLRLIKSLALHPYAAAAATDRLQLNIAHAQLLSFSRFNGYSQLPQFYTSYGALTHDPPTTNAQHPDTSGALHPSKKKKSLSDLMDGKKSNGFAPKRKSLHPFPEDSTLKSIKRMASLQTDFDTESPSPQSFKVGECIRRIASQLSGSPPILKHTGIHSKTYPSTPDEMLSQLCLAAQDPLKPYTFFTTIIAFFSDFRNSISIQYSDAAKRKTSDADTRCNTTFDFEDMGDSYWTDRIIQSSPEEQPTRTRRKTQGQSSFGLSTEFYTSFEPEDPLQLIVSDLEEQNHDEDYVLAKEKKSRKYCKKKKVSPTDKNASLNHDVAAELTNRSTKDTHTNDIFLTELFMGFTDPASIPSVIKLNNIFRRFGPLKESETKVLKDTNSARVVFKKQTDAEVACNSAAKFSIFGAVHVRYQLSLYILKKENNNGTNHGRPR